MTRALFLTGGRMNTLVCAGHAGFAEEGPDVLCAGISALTIALDERLMALMAQRRLTAYRRVVKPGSVRLTAAGDGAVAEAFGTAAAGLSALAKRYPACLQCKRLERRPKHERTHHPLAVRRGRGC